MIVWVSSIEVKTIKTGRNAGNPYDMAICKDENGKDINFGLFEPELKKLFANAKENSQAIDLVTELKGDFMNAVSGKLLDVEVAPPAPNTNGDMSKEDWTTKQRIERESIEAQTAVKTVLSLDHALLTKQAKTIYQKALDWCETKIDATTSQVPKSTTLPQKVKNLAESVGAEVEEVKDEGAKPLTDLTEFNANRVVIPWKDKDVLSYIKAVFKVELAETVEETVAMLNQTERESLFKYAQDKAEEQRKRK